MLIRLKVYLLIIKITKAIFNQVSNIAYIKELIIN